jgi:hypothetical protein
VDTGLDENETELAILVLAVALKVLADGDSLLDEEVKVLRDLRGEAYNKVTLSALCLTKQRQKIFLLCVCTLCMTSGVRADGKRNDIASQ